MQARLRTDSPIDGRVYAPGIHPSPVTVLHARQCRPIPEVEYQALLGADLPPRQAPYSHDEVTEAVASLHPGIELAECRFAHDGKFPPLEAILAGGAGAGAGAIGHGPPNADWRSRDIAGCEVVLYRNGEVARRGSTAGALDHPMIPLTWLANELSRTGVGMRAGQMISTGTLTGMLRPKAGDIFEADFGEFGRVRVGYA